MLLPMRHPAIVVLLATVTALVSTRQARAQCRGSGQQQSGAPQVSTLQNLTQLQTALQIQRALQQRYATLVALQQQQQQLALLALRRQQQNALLWQQYLASQRPSASLGTLSKALAPLEP
jgi:hypothetical protein